MNESIRRKRIQIRDQMEKLEQTLNEAGILVTEERRRIVEMDPMALIESLREGHLSALDVLKAFQSKALEVTKEINCITEFIPEAEGLALACDRLPSEERGPLHGVPISIKDNVHVKGMDTTLGLAKYLYNPASSHAVVLEVLIQKGAIPFCKTNVPQILLSFCCSNPVFGETKNPFNPKRSPGGSSGGEAALISAGGSVLGVGSDLAGSVRVPATFCGCVGMKPTMNRISSKGLRKSLHGMVGNVSTVGLMGRDCNIVSLCLKLLVDSKEMRDLDLFVPSVPWSDAKLNSSKKLVFGYFDSIDYFPTSPGVKRAVHEAKYALQKAGHDVIPFEYQDFSNLFKNAIKCITADAGKSMTKYVRNEKLDPSLAKGINVTRTPAYLRPFIKLYLYCKSSLSGDIIQTGCHNSYNLWRQLSERENIIHEFRQLLKQKNIDLLLSPAYSVPATEQLIPPIIFCACVYTVIFNYLDFPSGCVPVTRESESDQKLLDEYPEAEFQHRIAKQATRGATGLPIGVLVSGATWEDELVTRGMMVLEQALKDQQQ